MCICAHVIACSCEFMNNVYGKVGVHANNMVVEFGGDRKRTSMFAMNVCAQVCVCVCAS